MGHADALPRLSLAIVNDIKQVHTFSFSDKIPISITKIAIETAMDSELFVVKAIMNNWKNCEKKVNFEFSTPEKNYNLFRTEFLIHERSHRHSRIVKIWHTWITVQHTYWYIENEVACKTICVVAKYRHWYHCVCSKLLTMSIFTTNKKSNWISKLGRNKILFRKNSFGFFLFKFKLILNNSGFVF